MKKPVEEKDNFNMKKIAYLIFAVLFLTLAASGPSSDCGAVRGKFALAQGPRAEPSNRVFGRPRSQGSAPNEAAADAAV